VENSQIQRELIEQMFRDYQRTLLSSDALSGTPDNAPMTVNPFLDALSVISGRWKLPILFEVFFEDGIRFNALKKNLDGISVSMLSTSLRELKDDGLIERKQYNELPLRVEYFLTEKGVSLFRILIELLKWQSDSYS